MGKTIIDRSNLRGDFFGGLTAGVVALPLALAFGVQSGMGAIAGLYGAIAIGMIAAWFGGTPTQISGPTGPMTVVSAVVIATAIDSHGSLEAALGTMSSKEQLPKKIMPTSSAVLPAAASALAQATWAKSLTGT